MQSDVYCLTCGKTAKCVVNDHMHLIPERAYAICEGPFASCQPPDAGAFLIPNDDDFEMEATDLDNDELNVLAYLMSQYPKLTLEI